MPCLAPHPVFVLALTVTTPAWAAPAASDPVPVIAAQVQARHDADIDLLHRAVDINSGTFNHAGVRATGALFGAEFATLGFHVAWVDGTPFGRAGHLLARRGTRGPRILFIGHLDTVFEADSPFRHFELDGDIARGPGTSDMKGGIVVMLSALHALAALGTLEDLRVTVVLTGDEEEPGEPLALARAALVDAARKADVALGFENADDDPGTAVIARRSSSTWTLAVTAPGAHSSQIFRDDVGFGAVFEAARILDGFRTALAGEEYLTFNPGVIAGGASVEFDAAAMTGRVAGKDNIVAPVAMARGDLRALTVAQRERAKTRMRAIVATHVPPASARIEFSDGYPPLSPSDGNRALLALLDEASRDLGHGPVTDVDPRRAGAADISFTGGIVPMALDGLGLLGGGNHTEQEFADLRTLPVQAQRVALLLHRIAYR
jgi:glutamate carboxypeptidase